MVYVRTTVKLAPAAAAWSEGRVSNRFFPRTNQYCPYDNLSWLIWKCGICIHTRDTQDSGLEINTLWFAINIVGIGILPYHVSWAFSDPARCSSPRCASSSLPPSAVHRLCCCCCCTPSRRCCPTAASPQSQSPWWTPSFLRSHCGPEPWPADCGCCIGVWKRRRPPGSDRVPQIGLGD